jgi:fatty-acid desaturase
MMEPVKRITEDSNSPLSGEVMYDVPKMIWNLGFILIACLFAPSTFTFPAFLMFLLLTYFSLLVGHSVGMHRMMIHRTFRSNIFMTRLLIYIGVLVGMSGPFGIIKIHDLRDWAQRKEKCHDFFSHKASFFQDIWWQLTSRFEFSNPPIIKIEPVFKDDVFLRFCERTWRWHQLGLAALLYYFGGWSFVVWGVFVRVAVSIVGHWTITYFCHNPGPGSWKVKNAAVQASNIRGLGLITYGECWHNNHHAFPESAKIGLEKGQSDPSWWFIVMMKKLGLVYDVRLPRTKAKREDLEYVN